MRYFPNHRRSPQRPPWALPRAHSSIWPHSLPLFLRPLGPGPHRPSLTRSPFSKQCPYGNALCSAMAATPLRDRMSGTLRSLVVGEAMDPGRTMGSLQWWETPPLRPWPSEHKSSWEADLPVSPPPSFFACVGADGKENNGSSSTVKHPLCTQHCSLQRPEIPMTHRQADRVIPNYDAQTGQKQMMGEPGSRGEGS